MATSRDVEATADGDASLEQTDLSLGAHRISAWVTDPDGGEASASILLNVYDPGEHPGRGPHPPLEGDVGVAGVYFDVAAEVVDEDDDVIDLDVRFRLFDEDELVGEPSVKVRSTSTAWDALARGRDPRHLPCGRHRDRPGRKHRHR